jgi:lipid-A-disaccharide synthase
VRAELLDSLLARTDLYASGLERVRGDRLATVAGCHFALCASGTATLEVGLVGTPLAVLYRLGTWTYWMAKMLVDLPHVSLVNLVLGRGVVPELIQRDASPERIADEVLAVLEDPERRAEMRSGLAELRERLGAGGASARAAEEIARRLGVVP